MAFLTRSRKPMKKNTPSHFLMIPNTTQFKDFALPKSVLILPFLHLPLLPHSPNHTINSLHNSMALRTSIYMYFGLFVCMSVCYENCHIWINQKISFKNATQKQWQTIVGNEKNKCCSETKRKRKNTKTEIKQRKTNGGPA